MTKRTPRRAPRKGFTNLSFLIGVCLAWPSVVQSQDSSASSRDRAGHYAFVMDPFTFESGATVPRVTVAYGTYGRLNAAQDNVVLLPSHYLADHHGYDWLIAPAGVLDTTRYFLVATELFGNGHSSSPSNTPEPFHGPRFPVATIRDNVEAVHRLLVEQLGVTHLRAIIGFSMGAQQAFQWAVSYPDFSDRIIAIAGTAKSWPHGIVRLEAQIAAIELDPTFDGGNYTQAPTRGIELFNLVWAGWLFSQEWWRQELWRQNATSGTTFEAYVDRLRKTLFAGLDANDLILQARTWERHDVGGTPGFHGSIERALASIKVPVLYMPSETDLYFPVTDARYEAQFIPKVTLRPVPSLWGHSLGGEADGVFLNEHIAAFLGAPAQ
jgi:homoserine O-acetyltransferase